SVYRKFKDQGIEMYRVLLPLGMDINEVAVRSEEVQDTLLGLLEESVQLTQEELAPQTKNAFELESTFSPARPEEALLPTEGLTFLAAIPTQTQPEVKVTKDEVEVRFPERTYISKGLFRNTVETLKVTLKVIQGDRYHVDTVDLLSYKGRTSYISTSSNELGEKEETIKKEIGKLINTLEEV
ncbi:DNA primase, partial [Leptospira santarosai]|nr:DNA primase [Leptospira santarosai]